MRFLKRLRKLPYCVDIFCETLSNAKHDSIRLLGGYPVLKESRHESFDNILICFPPGERYAEEVSRTLSCWNKKGRALLISSTGVYSENSGQFVDESSPVNAKSQLVSAENIALSTGASVFRLAGLYGEHSGPHIYWARRGKLSSLPEGWINLLHREDATTAIELFFRHEDDEHKNKLWNVSDGSPIQRQSIATIWEKRSKTKISFEHDQENQSFGKKISNKRFLQDFLFSPTHPNFGEFCRSLEVFDEIS